MKRSFLYSLVCMLLLGVTACVDDEIRPFDEIPEGETTVSATIEFNPLTPALETRAVAGDAIKSIESLCILVYGLDNKLISKHVIKNGPTAVSGYTEGEMPRKDKPGRDTIAESKTPYARFSLKLPYGRYHIYAVANMGDLSGYDFETVDELKGISLTWQKDVAKNNQMLGHFTEKGVYSDDSYVLTINRKNMEVRAGIQRLASKVTLAFDGSKLKEGVFVYIKSVQIKDIPRTCFLGNKNMPMSTDELTDGDTIRYDIQSYTDPNTGNSIIGSAPLDDHYLARVTKGRPYYPHDDNYGKMFHTETERALFFYENMQGVHKEYDKRQDADNNGALDHPGTPKDPTYLPKDGIPNGSYIEVEAYYRSINEERIGSGVIKYRFMLGKNVTTDYNAERNHHYKLTLKFKNFANDADWHIDYKEEDPDIIVPEIYYVSYLYNHQAMLPVKINTGGSKLTTLHAEITDNAWAPYQAPLLDYYRPMDPDVSDANKNPWNGFLSLFRPEDKVIEYENSQDFTKDLNLYNGISMRYWEAKSRGKRDYDLIEGEHDSETNGRYHVSKDANGDLHLLMPIFTRAKNILTRTAYTGNNPFVAYQRKAIIKLTGQLEDGRKLEKNARVMQVRRVVNPKGIWRDYNNDADFHVVLTRLPRESDESFEELTSEGKWRAYPLVDKNNLVSLDGVNDTVKGSTGTPIDFTIHFNGTCTASQNRCAIIRVEYHDYNCSHLIFVRQGRTPIDMLGDGKTYWHTYNMRTVDSEASCPLEEGSMFKFGNWDQPIDAVNNVETDFLDRSDYPFSIAGKQTTAYWKNITSQRASDGYFSAPKIDAFVPGKTVSVASLADFNALWESKVIGNAYGVMYGNDATKTLKKVNEVYGHRRNRHLSSGEGYGMRGVFVYNTSTGDNLFFPIGATGYGRRRHSDGSGGKGTAVLRYASRNKPMDTGNPSGSPDWVNFRPLFYDLYRRPGAIYWAQRNETVSRTTGNITGIGWDINYFTFDFNYLPASNVYGATGQPANTSDACFVRCVEK